MSIVPIELRACGETHSSHVQPRTLLVHAMRDEPALTGRAPS